jgi:hypothetical protein
MGRGFYEQGEELANVKMRKCENECGMEHAGEGVVVQRN